MTLNNNIYEREYQERLLNEISELQDRIEKLETFISHYAQGGSGFKPTCSLELMTMQLNAMHSYLTILQVRKNVEGLSDK